MENKKIKSAVMISVLIVIAFICSFITSSRSIVVYAEEFKDSQIRPVRLLGRTTYEESEKILYFDYTLSGIEFYFTGTECSINFSSDFLDEEDKYAVVGIFINDSETETARLPINGEVCRYTVFQSKEEQTVKIKVVKLSEAKYGTVGIESIEITGGRPMIRVTEERRLLFEFIGDSITCGNGNESEPEEEFTTLSENGNMTYAAMTARYFGADISVVAYSGIGINHKTSSTDLLMPELYGYSGYSKGKRIPQKWVSEKEADVVCINLGTNDSNNIDKRNSAEIVQFKETYKKFLCRIREENPNAQIICCIGPMWSELDDTIEILVNEFQREYNDKNIGFLVFDEDLNTKKGIGSHPSVESHRNMAEVLCDYIEKR